MGYGLNPILETVQVLFMDAFSNYFFNGRTMEKNSTKCLVRG